MKSSFSPEKSRVLIIVLCAISATCHTIALFLGNADIFDIISPCISYIVLIIFIIEFIIYKKKNKTDQQ